MCNLSQGVKAEGREEGRREGIVMEYNELVRLWEYAFQMLYEKDIALFETDVQERSIAGRLAIYLQHKYDGGFKKDACVDLEYNREGNDIKRPHPEDVNGWIAPDILLHVRKTKNNIFYCEVKKKSTKANEDLLYLGIRLNFSRGRITALGSIPIKKRKDSSWKKTQGLRLGGMRIMVLNMIELGIMEIIIKMVIMLQHGKHQAGNYTKHQYPLKGKVYCGYCQKLMKYRVLKKIGPSFNCRFSATAVDSPCKRIPISEELLEHIVRNALTAQIKQAEYVLEILRERERKALVCFSALERQEEKLSAEKVEIVKQRVALYEQYADGNMSKEEFIRQRDAYRVQEDEKIEQIQRLRTEKDQIFLPVRKDADNLQTVVSAAEEAGDVMHLSQNVVETFIDRIEVFNDERVKIRFTFKDALNSYEEK